MRDENKNLKEQIINNKIVFDKDGNLKASSDLLERQRLKHEKELNGECDLNGN